MCLQHPLYTFNLQLICLFRQVFLGHSGKLRAAETAASVAAALSEAGWKAMGAMGDMDGFEEIIWGHKDMVFQRVIHIHLDKKFRDIHDLHWRGEVRLVRQFLPRLTLYRFHENKKQWLGLKWSSTEFNCKLEEVLPFAVSYGNIALSSSQPLLVVRMTGHVWRGAWSQSQRWRLPGHAAARHRFVSLSCRKWWE